jgi:hypothetical protein
MALESLSVVSYNRLNNGVHEIVPCETSLKAVQEIFQLLDEIFDATPEGETLRYILADYNGVGMQPINHTLRYAQAWVKKNPNHKPTRTLFLYQTNLLLATTTALITLINRSSRSSWQWRFYSLNDKDAGMAWLLSDK